MLTIRLQTFSISFWLTVVSLFGPLEAKAGVFNLLARCAGLVSAARVEEPPAADFFSPAEIEPGLFLSGAPPSAKALETLGVRAIVKVANHREDAQYVAETSQLYSRYEFAFFDHQKAPQQILTDAVKKILELRKQGVPVLVHCSAGVSRSPTAVALFLMVRDNLSWEEAVAKLKQKRPCVNPDPNLTNALMREEIVSSLRDLQ